MERVGKFEKISFPEFLKAMEDEFGYEQDTSGQEFQAQVREIYEGIELPKRATSDSAGYDIRTTLSFFLYPGDSAKIPTGIRVKIDSGWWLGCFPRSGLGFKYRAQLDNTVGVIDGDYYYADNEGHIFLKITNDSKQKKSMCVHGGDKIAQGIFIPYGITHDDNATGIRTGGLGSTGS